MLQQKADHQGGKKPFTEFRLLGSYIILKLLPNNKYPVRRIFTNKNASYSLHANASVHTPPTPSGHKKEWKHDPEVSLQHDDFYARAWECEYEKSIFDAQNSNATRPNSLEISVQSDLSTEETRNLPGAAHDCSREVFPQREQLCDVTDTYPDMEPDVETRSEQPNNSPTNPRSSKYNLRHNPKLHCNDDYRY